MMKVGELMSFCFKYQCKVTMNLLDLQMWGTFMLKPL